MIGSLTIPRTAAITHSVSTSPASPGQHAGANISEDMGAQSSRRGTATLEVALSLPLLLTLMVAIIWLGASVIAQSQVIVDARHQAWNARNETPGTGLLFLKDDFISKRSTEELNAGPMFKDFEAPESSHDIMVGTWDHRKLPLNQAPNWKQYVVAAGNAATGDLQTGATDAMNSFTQWKSLAATLWQTQAKNLIAELTGLGDSATSGMENSSTNNGDDDSRERQRVTQALRDKRRELQSAEKQLTELEDDDEDDSNAGLIEIYENRVERLKADIRILRADLEAMQS